MLLSEKKSVSSTTLISKASTDVSLVKRTLWLLNILYNQILGILTFLLFWLFFENYPKNELFFWHMALSTLAYVPLMAAAIILFSEDNMWSLYIRRTKRYWIHGALLTVSCVSVTIGISVEINYKTSNNSAHFQSNHAILGLVSWILVFLAVVIGLIAANANTFSSFIKPVYAKLCHNILGIAGFAIGMGSLFLKLTVVQRYCSENVYTASQCALWFIMAWSLLAAFKSLWGQLKSVFS